jgi:hypothetical protein
MDIEKAVKEDLKPLMFSEAQKLQKAIEGATGVLLEIKENEEGYYLVAKTIEGDKVLKLRELGNSTTAPKPVLKEI